MIILLSLCTIFLLLYLNTIIFNIQKELLYKTLYSLILCVILLMFFYNNIEFFLLYFSKILNDSLIIKDFQDIIIIYVTITSYLTALFFGFFCVVIFLF